MAANGSIIGGIVIFLVGSMLCGLSQDIWQLIGFRALQGLGGGIMFSNAFTIIGDLVPPADRGRWQGLFGGVWGLASVFGPTVGGYITDQSELALGVLCERAGGHHGAGRVADHLPEHAATTRSTKKAIDWSAR